MQARGHRFESDILHRKEKRPLRRQGTPKEKQRHGKAGPERRAAAEGRFETDIANRSPERWAHAKVSTVSSTCTWQGRTPSKSGKKFIDKTGKRKKEKKSEQAGNEGRYGAKRCPIAAALRKGSELRAHGGCLGSQR